MKQCLEYGVSRIFELKRRKDEENTKNNNNDTNENTISHWIDVVFRATVTQSVYHVQCACIQSFNTEQPARVKKKKIQRKEKHTRQRDKKRLTIDSLVCN